VTKFLTLGVVVPSFVLFSYAAGIDSSFNGINLDLDETLKQYSFLAAGHLYGNPSTHSVFPSASLLANIDMINGSGAKFFVSLGDNFRLTNHFPYYHKAFTSKLTLPLFNAIGNHDVTDRRMYEARFGKSYYHFAFNNALFVFLDSEVNGGNIMNGQLEFFRKTIREALKQKEIQHVFIFCHRLIWAVGRADYQIVTEHTNNSYPDNNFASTIEPVLVELSKHKEVYLVAGDIGVSWSLPLFYQKDAPHNITYVAVGIGDAARDTILRITVVKSEGVLISPISLTGRALSPIETYGLDYWRRHFEVADTDLTVLKTYWNKLCRMLWHPYFWVGFVISLPVVTIIVLLRRHF